MTPIQNLIQSKIYEPCALVITNYKVEKEGAAYEACRFTLNNSYVICRTAKITPKKIGQFVTFWKRNTEGVTEPFSETDAFDFYVINVSKDEQFGQFVIPKAVGVAKGLVSTVTKEGKRGFRVYPPWDLPTNNQAKRTQSWQLDYFVSLEGTINFDWVTKLYANNN